MSAVAFKGYNVVECSFANKLPPGTQIRLENKYQFNVKYAANNMCIGEMTVKVADRDNADKFFVNIVIRGVFTFTPGLAKEAVHIDAYKMLFPYARVFISNLTSGAGIPPIMIPDADIESQSIYRFDLGKTQDT